MLRVEVVLCTILAWATSQAWPQQASTPLSPSEAYTSAMAPFEAARAQPNDLTDADLIALKIGMAQASRDCLAFKASTPALAQDEKQLLALGRLCIFGQQYEPARSTLVEYLDLPNPPEREAALLLLVRALLGLDAPGTAEPQVRSLLRDYPYDAQIHYALDQVIDGLEGDGSEFDNRLALQLCTVQNDQTLPILAAGKALAGKDESASAGALFTDAIRCADLAASSGDPSASDTMKRLNTILQQTIWAGTADLAPMQSALAREQMVANPSPLASLRGYAVNRAGTLAPRNLSLMHGTVLLVPFTLWSPSALTVLRTLALSAPQQPIYAITSWNANTGQGDAPSTAVLASLRLWQQTLPPHVSLLIVPDTQLTAFREDTFPAGIVIRDGVIRSNSILSGKGAQRLLLIALQSDGYPHGPSGPSSNRAHPASRAPAPASAAPRR